MTTPELTNPEIISIEKKNPTPEPTSASTTLSTFSNTIVLDVPSPNTSRNGQSQCTDENSPKDHSSEIESHSEDRTAPEPTQNELSIKMEIDGPSQSLESINPRKRKTSPLMDQSQDGREKVLPPPINHQGARSVSPSGSMTQPRVIAPDQLSREVKLLKSVLLHTSPEAAQQVLRDEWRCFLFTNAGEDHLSYVLRAGIKNATNGSLARVLRDHAIYKDTFVQGVSKRQVVVDRVLKNTTSNQLLDLVPTKVLDQVVADRLKTVPAKVLIKWLAEADRLGFSQGDILEDDADENVTIAVESPVAGVAGDEDIQMSNGESRVAQAASLDPLQLEQERTIAKQKAQLESRMPPQPIAHSPSPQPQSLLRCPICHYDFEHVNGYNFHIQKKICTKEQPIGMRWYCPDCAQGFTTKQGKLYHEKKRVCLGEEDDAQSPTEQLQIEANPSLRRTVDPSRSQPQVSIPRPPLHTPTASHHFDSNSQPVSPLDQFRQSPSELSPERLAALNAALTDIEDRYRAAIEAIPADSPLEEREKRIVSLKNGNASRKSQIRKAFGVTLRMREKDKEAARRYRNSIGGPVAGPSTVNRVEEFRAGSSGAGQQQHRPQQRHQSEYPSQQQHQRPTATVTDRRSLNRDSFPLHSTPRPQNLPSSGFPQSYMQLPPGAQGQQAQPRHQEQHPHPTYDRSLPPVPSRRQIPSPLPPHRQLPSTLSSHRQNPLAPAPPRPSSNPRDPRFDDRRVYNPPSISTPVSTPSNINMEAAYARAREEELLLANEHWNKRLKRSDSPLGAGAGARQGGSIGAERNMVENLGSGNGGNANANRRPIGNFVERITRNHPRESQRDVQNQNQGRSQSGGGYTSGYASESGSSSLGGGGISRPGSAGAGGTVKRVPVGKAQRQWEALNRPRSGLSGGGEREREREREGTGESGEKGVVVDKGKGREIVGGIGAGGLSGPGSGGSGGSEGERERESTDVSTGASSID